MRYMIIVKGSYEDELNQGSGADFDRLLVEMGRFNEEMIKAGVMLAGEGLVPSKFGARVKFEKGKPPTVKDGPFTEAKELVGGFWILQVKDMDEALSWAKRIPFETGEVEVRRVSEMEDFSTSDPAAADTLRREQEFRDTGKWPEAKPGN